MKERTWIAALGLIGSLSFYYYSKRQKKDAVPYTMIGGFIGALAGELIAGSASGQEHEKENDHDRANTLPNTHSKHQKS